MNHGEYIWQSDDWPNWRYDLAVLAGPLADASHAQGRLIGRLTDVGMAMRDQATLAALTQTELAPDPLGYDTSDLATCALEMAAAALSGRNRDAVAKEIEQVERRFGFSSARAPGSAATDGSNRGDADLNCTSRSPPTQEFG